MHNLKRFFGSVILVLILSNTLLADNNLFEKQIHLAVIYEVVKPMEKERIGLESIERHVEKWIKQYKIEAISPAEKKPNLEIIFPKVVIDDVVVYRDGGPKNQTPLSFNRNADWNHPTNFDSSKNPG